jgi:hypothetical protein
LQMLKLVNRDGYAQLAMQVVFVYANTNAAQPGVINSGTVATIFPQVLQLVKQGMGK